MTKIAKTYIFGLVFLLLGMWLCNDAQVKAGTYATSAHGDTTYGVNRSATSAVVYTKGHCGHCHEQHASIGGDEPAPAGGAPSKYALFSSNFTSQTQDFCLDCHKGVGSVQVSFGRANYDYAYWFGGDSTLATPSNIYDAFNPGTGSSHNLSDILTFVKAKWPATFGNESNPCNACHNPHLSTRGYPIVRPSAQSAIWGDSAGEKMSDYAASHGVQYQAPYRYGSTNTYEPDGSATTDGSNLPDYVTFCSDCHNATNVIYSTTLGRNVKYIDWGRTNRTNQPGDYHGSVRRCFGVDGNGDAWRGDLKDPFHAANYVNFITCCTDCHEPHGSAKEFLLRVSVNGVNHAADWTRRKFCESCHNWAAHCSGGAEQWNCTNCHFHDAHSVCWGAAPCSLMGPGGYGQGHTF